MRQAVENQRAMRAEQLHLEQRKRADMLEEQLWRERHHNQERFDNYFIRLVDAQDAELRELRRVVWEQAEKINYQTELLKT